MYGYNRNEFSVQQAIDNRRNTNGNLLKEKDPENPLKDLPVRSSQHWENYCYYCMIDAKNASIKVLDALYEANPADTVYRAKKLAYYRALAREKNKLVKVSDYINSSLIQN